MNVRYVSKDLEWTEAMKVLVHQKITDQIARWLHTDDFEISMHFDLEGRHDPHFALWIVLQTFDGGHNQIQRRQGYDFATIVHELAEGLRSEFSRSRPKFCARSFLAQTLDLSRPGKLSRHSL